MQAFARSIVGAPFTALDKLANKIGTAQRAIAGFVLFRVAQRGLQVFANAAQELDSLAKLTEKLNGTAESLSALRYVARLSGTTLEALWPSLTQFSKGLEEARKGSESKRLALADLGIGIDDLRGKQIDYIELLSTLPSPELPLRLRAMNTAATATTAAVSSSRWSTARCRAAAMPA